MARGMKLFVALLVFVLATSAEAGTFSSYPLATEPLGGAENVPMDQGIGCVTNTAPCNTVRAPSARLGQPPQTNCAAIAVPFKYQTCWNTALSPSMLQIYDGTNWISAYGLDTVNHFLVPPVGGGAQPQLASAATVDLCSGVPQASVVITGAVNITSFGSTCPQGTLKWVHFFGSPLVSFGSAIQLPGSADITPAPGDVWIVEATGSGNWIADFIQPNGNLYAPLVSPHFSGVPTAPTPAVGDNSTKIATTAFVHGIGGGFAPINSPNFTGTPTAPTPAAGSANNDIATTSFVAANFAPKVSPVFTGVVTIPTPFTLGAISVTTTGTQLNLLSAATGTTGTTSSNVVFSNAPTFTGAINGFQLQLTGQLVMTAAIGTAPFIITSTTLVPNLYVARAQLADTTTTNANLTGVITSAGNLTSIALQTGTGTRFVVDTSPTILTPALTTPTMSNPTITGTLTASGGITISGAVTFTNGPTIPNPVISSLISSNGNEGVCYLNGGNTLTVATSTCTNPSDERLKRDWHRIPALLGIMALHPGSFEWLDGRGPRTFGIRAQEIKAVFPELVEDSGDTVITLPDGERRPIPHTLGTHYDLLVVPLIAVVQEQQRRIERLEGAVRVRGNR